MTYNEYIIDLAISIQRALIKYNKASNALAEEGVNNKSGFIDITHINNVNKHYKEWQNLLSEYNLVVSYLKKNKISLEDEIPLPKGVFVIKYVIIEERPEGNEWVNYVGYGGYFETRKEAAKICAELNSKNTGIFFVEARKLRIP